MNGVRRVLSPCAVLAAFGLLGLGLFALTQGTLQAATAPQAAFDALLRGLGAGLAWLLFGYLAIGALLTFLAALPGAAGDAFDRLADLVTPAGYRRAAQIALGLAVLAGPTVGVAAANPGDRAAVSVAGRVDLDRPGHPRAAPRVLPDLDRPGIPDADAHPEIDLDRPAARPRRHVTADPDPIVRPVRDHVEHRSDHPVGHRDGQHPAEHRTNHRTHQRTDHRYAVRLGDCLWDIARAHLPAGASAGEIDGEWRRWYSANRSLIGDDPNLIYVGQVLAAPRHQG